MFIKHRKELGSSFIRQRRNLMGLSVGAFIFYLLDGSIKKIPVFLGSIEIGRSNYIEYLMILLLLYFAWRFYIYRKMEVSSYCRDINDSLNNNEKFINYAKKLYSVHPENENINVEFNEHTYVFLDDIAANCRLRICSFNTKVIGGSGRKAPLFIEQIDEQGGQTLKLTTPGKNLLSYLPKTLADTVLNYPGFSDFVLPWLLFITSIGYFIINKI